MISIIVAMDGNKLIGNENGLPWYFPEDLKYFKKKTVNHKVAMGYKTYLSILKKIKKPLPQRENIVFSRSKKELPGVVVEKNLKKFLIKNEKTKEEVFIIGGASIYKEALKYSTRLYITKIDDTFEGNVFFPKVDFDNYKRTKISEINNLIFYLYKKR